MSVRFHYAADQPHERSVLPIAESMTSLGYIYAPSFPSTFQLLPNLFYTTYSAWFMHAHFLNNEAVTRPHLMSSTRRKILNVCSNALCCIFQLVWLIALRAIIRLQDYSLLFRQRSYHTVLVKQLLNYGLVYPSFGPCVISNCTHIVKRIVDRIYMILFWKARNGDLMPESRPSLTWTCIVKPSSLLTTSMELISYSPEKPSVRPLSTSKMKCISSTFSTLF